MVSGNDSLAESVAPLVSQHHRAVKEPQEVDDVVEVSSKMTRSVPTKVGGLVTLRWRQLRVMMESSPSREVSDILEGEEEEVPCCSGSLDFFEFNFLAEKEIPGSSSDEDEVDKVDHS